MNHSLISGREWSARFFAVALGVCLVCPIGCIVEPVDDDSGDLDDVDDVDDLEQGLDPETTLCISKCRSDPDTGTGQCKAARKECRQIAKDKAERRECGSRFTVCRETRRACIDTCKGGGGSGGKQP